MPECVILPQPDRLWEYCPSYGAAITFLTIYSCTTLVHFIQTIVYRKPFVMVLIMGGIWELVGFTLRVCSILEPDNGGFYSNMGILVLLAPLWINAFVYMALGRLVHFALVHDTVMRIRARRLTFMFVTFDITAFIMQASGGIMAAKSGAASTKRTGFHYKLCKPVMYDLFDETKQSLASIKRILFGLYTVLTLILCRNSWRLAEYATGVDSSLRLNEWWFYVFDALPMAGAMVLLNICNPAQVLTGPRADFSEEKKTRKLAKKEQKMAKQDQRQTALYGRLPTADL
ncbi:hypothetical protein PV05_03981 [Exophiala xenobiotica]|uniref:RTA1 domain protein n=1 Tax=Exophiala xenobiotica TaxID=348802 RepID=A0A0D2EV37_9EURO|nr:uncharacterized protein PV05_03981 [Exophiala xenobiotica]KIW59538.1 hypothetical protein PV05_03981 [Exophiala xenobiotica]